MLKKWLSISLVALLLMGGLVACSGGEQPADTNTETEDTNAPATEDSTGMDSDASETSGTEDSSTDSSDSTDSSSTETTN